MVNTKKESVFLCSYKTYAIWRSIHFQTNFITGIYSKSHRTKWSSVLLPYKNGMTLYCREISAFFPRSLIPSSLIPINTPDWSRHCKSKLSHPGKGTDLYLLTRSVIWNFNKKWGVEQKKLFCWYQSSGNGRLPFYGQQRYIVKCTYRRESCSTAHLPHLVQLGTSFFPHLSCEKPNSKINKEVLLINLFCTIHTKAWLY